MSIIKREGVAIKFRHLRIGQPFAIKTVLYTRHLYREEMAEEREYLFSKFDDNCAMTIDRRTKVHFLLDQEVTPCAYMEAKRA